MGQAEQSYPNTKKYRRVFTSFGVRGRTTDDASRDWEHSGDRVVGRMDDSRLAAIFAREVLADLVRWELLSPEWAERILSWRHTGFSVHSKVRAKTSVEAERVGKYMIRPLLSLERLSLDEKGGQVCYRYREGAGELERMDYLEFIARVTSHIPDKGQVMVRYYGLYANAHRGKVKKASLAAFPLRIVEDKLRRIPSKRRAEMIRKAYEVNPLVCPEMRGHDESHRLP